MRLMAALRDGTLRVRSATEADREYLWHLHVATMKPHIEATWGWDEEWQQAYFEAHVDPSRRYIVLYHEERAGTIELHVERQEVVVETLEIAPRLQGQGLGTTLLQCVQQQAAESGHAVTLQVLKANPARTLYERLGFRVIGEKGTHYRMRWDVPVPA